MPNEPVPIEIRFTKTFQKNVKRLYKKHPSIRQDIDDLIHSLQSGTTPGRRIQGTGAYVIYKMRVKIGDSEKKKKVVDTA